MTRIGSHYGAPLDHDMLDRALPYARGSLGLALLAFTTITTIRGVGTDFAPLLRGELFGVVPVALVAGLGVAFFLSLGQWFTSERWILVYAVLLWVDARYTQRQIAPSIDTLSAYHMKELDSTIIGVVSFVVSWTLAILAARYGEILLLGKRKRPATTPSKGR